MPPHESGNHHGQALSIRDLTKVYETRSGERVEAMARLSFDVAAGEFLVVVGPSGCGKSTLLQILAGILAPTDGSISVDGEPITGPSLDRSMIFQSYALFPWLSVLENVQFGLKRKSIPREEQRAIALHYLQLVGLQRFCPQEH